MCNICIPLLSCNKVCSNISTNEGLSIRLLYESCVTALHFSLELKMFKLFCLWFCKAPTCYFYDCLPCWQCFRLASARNSNSDTQLSFFFSLLGSVSVFQFGLGEDLRLKLPAFGGKSNCSLQKHCMSWLPFVGVFAAITGFGGETLTWQLWY